MNCSIIGKESAMDKLLVEHVAIALFEDKTGHVGKWSEYHKSVKSVYRREARIALKAANSYKESAHE
jgi:hypothetical protein